MAILVSLSVDPVRSGALKRGLRLARYGQSRQSPIEADEFQLRENFDQPARQASWTGLGTVPAEQVLELLTGHPLPES